MIELEDIPRCAARAPRGHSASGAVPSPRTSRGSGRCGAASSPASPPPGATAGLKALGVFPPAREALSSGFQLVGYYDIYPRCPSYAANHNCSPGCGPSYACSWCCRTSGKYKGFHKSGVSHPGWYKLRPSQCYSGGYDGWLWAYSKSCGKCKKGVTWRCHDGWKKSKKGNWYKTICRKATACKN
ncbi:hypothetical protein [Actinomadura madurae]|uniref:hypothetical protein n=1 Tax=Actinomadura madurae TaxID=1993 RepID=UPI0020D2384F|nr:hypothetical protein [Actinomadura madurae]MCQ0014689.1 hypothetical protein [Actinomadura madurae]